jgi:hypothetical protein
MVVLCACGFIPHLNTHLLLQKLFLQNLIPPDDVLVYQSLKKKKKKPNI